MSSNTIIQDTFTATEEFIIKTLTNHLQRNTQPQYN